MTKTRLALISLLALGAFSFAATPALASGKPFVETKPATSIHGTEATLNGVVNPNGAETKYYFEYGPTISYGSKTAEVSVGSGTTNLEELKAISGLTAKTTYHFRIVATNGNGTTDGSDEVFTTTALVPPEFVLGGGELFPVMLEGSSSAIGQISGVGGSRYDCDDVNSKGSITGSKALSLTVELEHCQLGTKEFYTLGAEPGHEVFAGSASLVYISKAKKEVGVLFTLPETNIYVEGELFQTVRGTIVVPLTPVSTKTTKVDLTIHGNGNGKPTVESYENEQGEVEKAKLELNSGGGFKEAAFEVGGELQLTASEGKSLTVSLLHSPPTAITKAATAVTGKEATLHGTVNPDGAEAKYFFEYGTEKEKYTHKTEEASAGSGTAEVAVSKIITGLTASTTYYYRVVASNEGGTTDGAEDSFTTPTKPTVETKPASGVDGSEATLNGIVNPQGVSTTYYFEYGPAAEKTKYEYRTAEAGAGSGTTNVEELKAVIGLTSKTSYRFRIVATNAGGTSEGAEQTFTTTASVAPEFVLGEGEILPVTLEGSFPSVKSDLSNPNGEAQSCSGAKVKGSITSAKALSLTLELEKCVKGTEKCNTAGAEAGREVLPGSGSLVYLDKATKEIGILFTQSELKIECPENINTLKLRGTIVIPVTPANTKTTKVDLALQGNGKGKPTVESYENEKGEAEKAKLELNIDGAGYKESALETGEALDLTANKSLTIEG
jgi:hypothetical protein